MLTLAEPLCGSKVLPGLQPVVSLELSSLQGRTVSILFTEHPQAQPRASPGETLKACGQDKCTPFLFPSLIYYPFLHSLFAQGLQDGAVLLSPLPSHSLPPSHSLHPRSALLIPGPGSSSPAKPGPGYSLDAHPADSLVSSLLVPALIICPGPDT